MTGWSEFKPIRARWNSGGCHGPPICRISTGDAVAPGKASCQAAALRAPERRRLVRLRGVDPGRRRRRIRRRSASRPAGRGVPGRRCGSGGGRCRPGRSPAVGPAQQPQLTQTPAATPLNRSPARIVAALLRDGDRVLLCHRSPGRRWYPDVWDVPGGHVEEAERPGAALVRELREELGITITEPPGPPMREIRTATVDMQIWLVEVWTG